MTYTHCFRFIALLTLAVPVMAYAELGGQAAAVQADQVSTNPGIQRAATSSPQFSVQQTQTPNGVTIKEFIASSGTVFAVTWSGPLKPDLKQLLGQYFNDYVNAAKTNRGGNGHLGIQRADLVVQSIGRMGAFAGIAYLPGQMPPGVTAAQLQ